MTEEIVFSQLIEDDLNTINDLHSLFPKWKRKSLIKKLKDTYNGKDIRFVAKKNGKIISHVRFQLGKGLHKHRIEMVSLIVTQKERRKGIAEKLLAYSEKNLPEKIKLIILAVDKNNKPAIGLYKKLKYEKYGLLEKASIIEGKYVDNVMMKKDV